MPLLAQIPIPTVTQVTDLGKLGEVVLIALALLGAAIAIIVLAIVLFRVVKNSGDGDKADRGLLKEMIDLATSYKSESAEARDAYRQEAAATRAVVQESNEAQRETNAVLKDLTHATNEQTGEIRKLPAEIQGLRFDFKEYQSINADEIEGFGRKLEDLRTEMVAFKGDIQASIEKMLEQITVTNNFVEQAVNEHQTIIDAGKQLIAKADHIISLFPPTPPDKVIPLDTAPPAELPKAVGE